HLYCCSSIIPSTSPLPLPCTPTVLICTLSLHDALPISRHPRRVLDPEAARRRSRHLDPQTRPRVEQLPVPALRLEVGSADRDDGDRKSTRLNSSHVSISYAVFCLKKKIITECDLLLVPS